MDSGADTRPRGPLGGLGLGPQRPRFYKHPRAIVAAVISVEARLRGSNSDRGTWWLGTSSKCLHLSAPARHGQRGPRAAPREQRCLTQGLGEQGRDRRR